MMLRRLSSAVLAAALVLGAVPPQASAQVVRVAVGEAGSMPVSPVSGQSGTAALNPSLSLGAATLNGSLSAPSITPAPSVTANAAATPVAANAAIPALAGSAVMPAAAEDKPELPEAPKAATPAAAKTWRDKLPSWLGGNKKAETKIEAPAAEPPAETAKADADKVFDGSEAKTGETAGPVSAKPSKSFLTQGRLGAYLARKAAARAALVDEFGGPKSVPMTLKQRVGYGLKSGLNMIGVAAILNVTLRPVLELFAWPQFMSDQALRGFGRVALLTKFGPNEIIDGLANAPGTFLGISLPMAVTMEEISFRLMGFGLTFLLIAAIKPFSRWVASMIDSLPNAAGVVGISKKFLNLGEKISHFAFPIAAALSSFKFAAAHMAAWGVDPFVLLLNLTIGLYLSHVAYRSRSLVAPIVAHWAFNLAAMGVILAGMIYSPMAATAIAIILGLAGVSSLYHDWLAARKLRKAALGAGGKALMALLIAGSLVGGMSSNVGREPQMAAHRAAAATVERVQEQKTEKGVTGVPAKLDTAKAEAPAAPADTAKVESRADMVARVMPAVVNPIIHMGQGYALGSGFILTPEGVFITNGHVVGDKKPGEIINARVPDFPMELRAKVLAVNHDKDLAIVQLQPRPDGKPWPTVKLASQAPRPGDDVVAIGNPRDLKFSVSHGVVSAMDGRGNMYVKKMQTDAAINPGNSGGPLFNMKGEVVGVNTEIFTESGGSEGLGFAIMAPEVAQIMDQFSKTGNIATASLGIIANLSDPMKPEAGLQIEYVRPGSAAEKAGLMRGDLIIGVGEATIEEGGGEAAGHIAAALSKMIPGEKATVTILRGDEPKQVEVTMDAKVTLAPKH